GCAERDQVVEQDGERAARPLGFRRDPPLALRQAVAPFRAAGELRTEVVERLDDVDDDDVVGRWALAAEAQQPTDAVGAINVGAARRRIEAKLPEQEPEQPD